MFDKAMAELETCGGGLPITEEGVVVEDIHGVLTTWVGGVLMKHVHAQLVPEHGSGGRLAVKKTCAWPKMTSHKKSVRALSDVWRGCSMYGRGGMERRRYMRRQLLKEERIESNCFCGSHNVREKWRG